MQPRCELMLCLVNHGIHVIQFGSLRFCRGTRIRPLALLITVFSNKFVVWPDHAVSVLRCMVHRGFTQKRVEKAAKPSEPTSRKVLLLVVSL